MTNRRLVAVVLALPLVLAGALLWPYVYSRLVAAVGPIPGPLLLLSLVAVVGLLFWAQTMNDRRH